MIQIYNQISFYINLEIIKIYNSFYEFNIKEIYFLVSFKFLDKFFLLSGKGSAFLVDEWRNSKNDANHRLRHYEG